MYEANHWQRCPRQALALLSVPQPFFLPVCRRPILALIFLTVPQALLPSANHPSPAARILGTSVVNQFFQYHFFRLAADGVHRLHPLHGRFLFQFLRHALLLGELLRQQLQSGECRLLGLVQVCVQPTRRQQVEVGHPLVLLQIIPNLEGVDTVEQQIAIAKQKAGIREGEAVALERFEVVRH